MTAPTTLHPRLSKTRYELPARVIVIAIGLICLHGVYSSFVYGVRTEGGLEKILPVTAATVFLWIVYRWRESLARLFGRAAPKLGAMPSGRFWLMTLSLGVAARVLWWQFVPFHGAMGDPPVNLELARNLLDHGSYIASTTFGTYRGLYPPGLPLALVPFLAAFADVALAVLVANLCFFLAAVLFTYLAVQRLGDEAHARLAALVLAVLPNLVMYASLPLKEPLIVAELAAFTYALSRAFQADRRATVLRWALAAGAALGMAALTQSSLAPAVGIVVLIGWLGAAHRHRKTQTLALILGAALVIAPWSLRQSLLFGKFVPLTTGAGWSFYTGNNPHSLGGFTSYEVFFPDLLSIDESDLSAVSFQRANAYVKAHPERLVELAARRQLAMTCCLDHAQVDTLMAAQITGRVVDFWKLVVCAAWLALIVVTFVNFADLMRWAARAPALSATLALPLLSFVTHSIMEGNTRHMTMHIGVWVLMATLSLYARASRQRATPEI